MSDNDVTLTKNETANRFELRVGENLVGFIDYRALASGAVDMFHTEIDPAHGGQGLGQRLAAFALADAREQGYQVVPSCPFIDRYLDRHPEDAELRA